jgi:thiamine pyrophosphokinase
MNVAIICNGNINDYVFYKKYLTGLDFIIVADAGAAHARQLGLIPDLLIGDFDSISLEDLEFYKKAGVEIQSYPVMKDKTDTEIAIDIVIDRFEKNHADTGSLLIIGALGTRFDHSMANIFLLRKLLNKGIRAKIVNEYNEIMLIDNKIKAELTKQPFDKISLLPLSQVVTGVTTHNMHYPLNNATVEMGSTWGVSNEFLGSTASVSIKSGEMLVILSRDDI